jgi:hypothetical protein
MKIKKLLSTLAIVWVVLFAGCKKDDYVAIDGGPCPVVVSVTPYNGQLMVGRSNVNSIVGNTDAIRTTLVTAKFNKKIDSKTINTSSFTVTSTTAIAGTVSYSDADSTATFTATSKFADNATFTARVTTAVKDLMGNALQQDFVWTFSTGTTILPVVLTTSPINLATNVALNKVVTATFNVPMDGSTMTSAFTLMNGTTPVLGAVSTVGAVVSFAPSVALNQGTVYTAKVTTASKNLDGSALAKDTTWTFTTLTVLAPTVISTDPTDLDANVTLNQDVTATFSVAMDNTTITTSTFTIMEGLNPVLGVVSYAGVTATFNPNSDFVVGKTYTATITNGVKNAAGTNMVNNHVWTFTIPTVVIAGPLPINLGCAAPFAVMAGSTISSTGPSIINGDIALSPGSALIGFPPGIINGVQEITTPTAADAKSCLTSAYIDGQGRSLNAISLPGQLGGLTLAPGLYSNSSTSGISGTGTNGILTLDAQGNANAVWIFQIGSTLTTDSGTSIVLAGGAQAKNIFWVVGTSATLGTTSIFYGTVMADQAITLKTNAVLNGRALTRIAAVTLDASTINIPQ